MGIYRRKDSPFWWMSIERAGQRPVQESTGVRSDSRDAKLARDQKETAMDVYRARCGDLARMRHKLPRAKTIPFSKQADWYELHVLPHHRGAARERFALTHLRTAFGDDDLLTITLDRAKEYATARLAMQAGRTSGRTVTASTVNRELAVLRAILASAIPKHLLESPLKDLKPLRAAPRPKRTLTVAEEQRLLAQLEPADRAFYLVAVDSLMRLSNVLDLKRSEDKGAYFELLDSKTGPYRAMVSARARAALDALPVDGEYYFAHRRKAKNPRDFGASIRGMLRRACARCSPPIPFGRASLGITFHTATRATGATRMLQAGVDLRTLQAVGNWRDLRSTQRYLTTQDALMVAAVNSIAPRSADVNEDPKNLAEPQYTRKFQKGAPARRKDAGILRGAKNTRKTG